MEEEVHIKCEQMRLRECDMEDKINAYDPVSHVWVKEEVLMKQEATDLEPGIKQNLNLYLEKELASSNQYEENEINEEQESIPQVWVKQEIKQEPHDLLTAADEEELQLETIPDSSHDCMAKNEEDKINAYDPVSHVWVKEEVLMKQEATDLEPGIKQNLNLYLEKELASSNQYEENEINEEQESIPQVWVKQEIKQEPHDLLTAADEEELQLETIPDSSHDCMAKNENVEYGDKRRNEEGTELLDVKSVCDTVQEKEQSASDVHVTLETARMKYCCRQNMLLGKNCDICKKNTDDLIFKCDVCDKGFSRKFALRSHLTVHGERNFQCDICLKRFGKQVYLNVHKQTVHCNQRNFFCSTCGKGFKTCSMLKGHLVHHSDKRDYSCSVCGKSFIRRYSLGDHLRTHTGDRQFQCTICSKRYHKYLSLMEHERTHTGEKPHQCDLCEKAFHRRGSFLRHRLLHTKEKPYICDLCQEIFYTRSHLVHHLRRHPKLSQNK